MRSFLYSVLIFCVYGCTSGSEDFEPDKFTLTIISSEGGSVNSSGGTYNEGTELTIIATSNEGYEFTGWEGFDSSEESITFTITSNIILTANFSPLYVESITVTNPINELVISRKHKFQINGRFNNGEVKDISDLVELELNDDRITLLGNNEFTVRKSGQTSLKIKYQNLEALENFNSINIEYVQIGSELISNDNCSNRVPIVIINYFPTSDGVNHDENIGPSGYWDLNHPTVEQSRNKVHSDLVLTKRIIEYGSRYRDYGTKEIDPYICLDVVKYINLYELDPYVKLRPEFDVNDLDYFKMFERINMKDLVNNNEVKEVWITIFPKSPEYPSVQNNQLDNPETYYNIPETNMSSPFTGDISNSFRIPEDLPIYDNTYVVYGYNGHRGVDTNIHNRGHQIEVQMMWLEQKSNYDDKNQLFWNNFVGVNDTDKSPIGRSGMTHFPPNTNIDYDYCNESLVESDIKNWKPSGGEKEFVNCRTWTTLNYDINFNVLDIRNNIYSYSNDSHTKWLLYWFQSIPGEDNNIPYEKDGVNYTLTNWWDIFYNWDDTISNNKTLWE